MIIDKWCIKRNSGNHEEINDWFSKKLKKSFTAVSDYHPYQCFNHSPAHWTYLHFPPKNGVAKMKKQRGYTEISTKEFFQFIYFNKTFIKSKRKKTDSLTIIRNT